LAWWLSRGAGDFHLHDGAKFLLDEEVDNIGICINGFNYVK